MIRTTVRRIGKALSRWSNLSYANMVTGLVILLLAGVGIIGWHVSRLQTNLITTMAVASADVWRQRKWDTRGHGVKRELKGLRGWDPTPSKGCS